MEIILGALAPKLHEQLRCNKEIVELLQMDADTITRLIIRGYISESTGRIARKRLIKKLSKLLNKQEDKNLSMEDILSL